MISSNSRQIIRRNAVEIGIEGPHGPFHHFPPGVAEINATMAPTGLTFEDSIVPAAPNS